MKQIKQKLQQEATVAKAGKGKTMAIIYKQDLDEKVNYFIKSNHIIELKHTPLKKCKEQPKMS
jgi:hypothetical protein